MSIFSKMDLEHKRNILKIIANLAAKDGQLLENEVQFLYQVGKSFHFTIDDIKSIVKETSLHHISIPKSEQDRMNVLYYLLFMMKADNDVNQKEINMVKRLGFKLGFRSQLVEDMIHTISGAPNSKVTPDQLLADIKRYMN